MVQQNPPKKTTKRSAGDNQANVLVRLAPSWFTPFHDGDVAYAEFQIDGHSEIVPMRSRAFRERIALLYFKNKQSALSHKAMETALNIFCAIASEAPQRDTFLRVAHYNGDIYVDLCNEKRQAVKISKKGWEVVDTYPVPFLRKRGMLALPLPEEGGTIEELYQFFSAGEDQDKHLLLSFLLGAYSKGPYIILALSGEQGSGKTTIVRIFKFIIDPNDAAIKAKPRNDQDVMIAANNSWLPVYDNISSLSEWLSDIFCGIVTGTTYSTRELFSNNEESLITAKRPLIINGIPDLATRGDLQSRAIVISLPAMEEWQRRPEKQFWAELEEARPRILGAIYSLLSVILRNLSTVRLQRPPRMADFAEWVTAAEPALSWQPGYFLQIYGENQDSSTAVIIEDSPVATALMEYLALNSGKYEGPAQSLLNALINHTIGTPAYNVFAPMRPNQLSGHLGRLAPAMRKFGINIVFEKPKMNASGKKQRKIIIEPTGIKQSMNQTIFTPTGARP